MDISFSNQRICYRNRLLRNISEVCLHGGNAKVLEKMGEIRNPGDVLSENGFLEKDWSVLELVSFLKSAYRPSDFEMVEQWLKSKEEALATREEALRIETEKNSRISNQNLELEATSKNVERELKGYRKKYCELEERCRKTEYADRVLADTTRRCKRIETELAESGAALERYQKRCCQLEEQCRKSEEDCRNLACKESMAREQTRVLADEIERKERELENYKKKCGMFETQIAGLEVNYRVACGREQESRERMEFLEDEVKKGREVGEKYLLLKVQFEELEHSKKLVEGELEVYKRKCGELEEQTVRMDEQYRILGERELEGWRKMMDLKELLEEISSEDQGNPESCKKTEDRNGIDCAFELQILNHCVADCVERSPKNSEVNLEMVEILNGDRSTPSAHLQVEQESASFDERNPAWTSTASVKGSSYKSVEDAKDAKKGNTKPEEECGNRVRRQLCNPERNTSPCHSRDGDFDGNVASSGAKSMENVIEISDSEEEITILKEIASGETLCDGKQIPSSKSLSKKHLDPGSKGNATLGDTHDNGKEMPSKKRLRKKYFDLSSECIVEKTVSSGKEDFPHIPTPKKRRSFIARKKRTSLQVVVDNLEDHLVSSEPRRNCMQVGSTGMNPSTVTVGQEPCNAPTNQSRAIPIGFASGDNMGESTTPRKRHLFPLAQCEKIKGTNRGISPTPVTAQEKLPSIDLILESHETSSQAPGNLSIEDEADELVTSSSSSDDTSEDKMSRGANSNDAFAQFLKKIRSRKAINWEYEADMLCSFGEDSELCMKAVCALYRRQTHDEKSGNTTFYINQRGFNKFDAVRASELAEFLTDGDPHGPLRKTVKELEKHDPKAIEYCLKIASRYSKQLFEIYQKKADPHFLPS